jgi:sodium-independent sulfate anion transporter 11
MTSPSDKIGHALAKGLMIDLNYRHDATEELARGDSIASGSSAERYFEREPTVADWFREIAPTRQNVKNYFKDLFPFLAWITRYNLTWLTGDLIAGN